MKKKIKTRDYEIKIIPGNEVAMFKQLVVYSRFLDVPLDELCSYSTSKLKSRIESTLQQMPEEELELTEAIRKFAK